MPGVPISPSHLRLLAKLEIMGQLSAHDREVAASLPLRHARYNANTDVVRAGSSQTESFLLTEGFVYRYQLLESGSRQVLAIHLPGDIPDLHSLFLRPMDHSLAALTPCRIAFIPHDALREAFRKAPLLGEALWRETLIDGAMFRQWLTNIGRRSGIERIAHLFCELYYRLRALNLTADNGFELPLSQTTIGDATGLTPVHVNRMLQQLRREGLISSQNRYHRIENWDELRKLAGFDPAYLQLDSPIPAAGS